MIAVQRAAGVRAVDRELIDGVGIPEVVLMDEAGRGVADAVIAALPAARSALVLCGPGNNGGDGYVVARHLARAGWTVRALAVAPPASPGCRVFHDTCVRLGLIGVLDAPDVVIDAVYGNGQRPGAADPGWSRWPAATLVALDVPTGVDTDTGAVIGAVPPRVDRVVTIGRPKPFLFGGAWCASWTGAWDLVDIGYADRGQPDAWLCACEPAPLLPPTANKWDRGHVGVLAGAPETAGAAVLVCRAALRGGAGLVTLHATPELLPRLAALPAEVMVSLAPCPSDRYDALVVGPGLGRSRDVDARRLWAESAAPAVFDADGLRLGALGEPAGPRVLTPHAGEAAAWLGEDWRHIEADRLGAVQRLRGPGVAAVLKGACPLVSGPVPTVFEGRCPALGTAGSGDVLAGLVGALLARVRPGDGAGAERVARMAVSAHLAAGRGAAVGVTAGELADRLPAVLGGAS